MFPVVVQSGSENNQSKQGKGKQGRSRPVSSPIRFEGVWTGRNTIVTSSPSTMCGPEHTMPLQENGNVKKNRVQTLPKTVQIIQNKLLKLYLWEHSVFLIN